jgi:hypothetical protein
MAPDVTGGYYSDGNFSGQPSYVSAALYYIFFSTTMGLWLISNERSELPVNFFFRATGPTGVYANDGVWTGTATVT